MQNCQRVSGVLDVREVWRRKESIMANVLLKTRISQLNRTERHFKIKITNTQNDWKRLDDNSDRPREETVNEVNVWLCVFWQSSCFLTLMWKMRTFFCSKPMKHHQAIPVQVLWYGAIQPLGGETPFHPSLGNLLDLSCGIPDAGAVSRVCTIPHPYPYIPSLPRRIPHSTRLKEGVALQWLIGWHCRK